MQHSEIDVPGRGQALWSPHSSRYSKLSVPLHTSFSNRLLFGIEKLGRGLDPFLTRERSTAAPDGHHMRCMQRCLARAPELPRGTLYGI
jgi:hypothetical protein